MRSPHTRFSILLLGGIALVTPAAAAGLILTGSYTGEVLVNSRADDDAVTAGLLQLAVEAQRGDVPHARVSVLYPHGGSMTETCVGDLFTVSNIDAPDAMRLFELWYEQPFLGDTLAVRVGQLAADAEFAGTDTGGLFINGTAGWPAIIGANVSAPAYPAATPGVRFAWSRSPDWTVRLGVFSGTCESPDAAGRDRLRHGLHLAWDDTFAIAEIEHATHALRLPGVVKVGAWYHSGDFADLRAAAETETVRGTWGGYASLDQRVTREAGGGEAEGLSCVGRLGFAPGDRNLLEAYCEAGFAYTGLLPGRPDDACGLIAAYGAISGAHRAAAGASGADPTPDHELLLEAAYRATLGSYVTVQAIASHAVHPGGQPGRSQTTVGLRTTLEF